MSTIEQNLQKLVDAKESIRTAIQNKKVAVPESASISTYSTYIDQIELKELQTKTYNITENGTIIISPDEGFDGISGGVIQVNVPSSGDYNGTVNVNILPADLPAVVTITYADKTETKTNETGMVTFKTYSGVDYELSFSDIEGYYAPLTINDHVNYGQIVSNTGKYLDDSEEFFEYTNTGATRNISIFNSNNGLIKTYSIDGGNPVSYASSLVNLSHGVHRIKFEFNPSYLSMASGTFSGITALTKVVIPSDWTKIGSTNMFKGTGIETITIPSNIQDAGSSTFAECKNLKSVIIEPGSDLTEGAFMFNNCTGLTSVTAPQLTIHTYMFNGCTSLSEINGSIVKIDDNCKGAFDNCSGLTSIDLGNAVPTTQPIDLSYTFNGCANLTSVILPDATCVDNMTSTFEWCLALTNIVAKSSVAPIPGSRMFTYLPSTGTLYYPSGSDYSTWLEAMPSGWTAVPV